MQQKLRLLKGKQVFLQLRQVIAQCRIMPTNQWAEKRELQRHCEFCTVVFTIKISSVILLIKPNEIQKETGTATFATVRHSNFENAFVSSTIVDFSQIYRNRILCNSKPQTTLISYSRFRTNFHLRLLWAKYLYKYSVTWEKNSLLCRHRTTNVVKRDRNEWQSDRRFISKSSFHE